MFTQVYEEIRQLTIAKVLDFYDHEVRGLDEAARQTKYQKMSASPFLFFRGSSHLFYYDVTRIPLGFDTPPETPTWIQGDLHFENFGVHGNAKGEIIYDVNDFDEGYLGSYLYDLIRMAVSVQLFAEEAGYDAEPAIAAYIQHYLDDLRQYAKGKNPSKVCFTIDNTKGPIRKLIKKAEKKKSELLGERTTVVDGQRQFTDLPDMKRLDASTYAAIEAVWPEYIATIDPEDRQEDGFYDIKDIVYKLDSGTASIGLERYYILVEGKGGEHEDLILEMKQAQSSVPSLFVPVYLQEVETVHQGRRIITSQKAMQAHEDPYLGYVTMQGKEYYVRERSPYKKKLKAKHIKNQDDLENVLSIQGQITAKIHARADMDAGIEIDVLKHHADVVIIESIGVSDTEFTRQIQRWSSAYAARTTLDFQVFLSWLATR
ncbi:DUF2252 domain-containing protein [Exiguobacterium sp. RIT594]|uniref:DUF2252 domain-containing protein n=1 Tax=Exiguobacterium sp. RIT594 TaxID=2282449 RepID=UPI000DF85DCC|nr:DUF2252 family protein [Exiguobacterium sp. RIT594]RDB32391.1 DUF2252 domain-containing protein [Exiguobacterium sp. RIT594]